VFLGLRLTNGVDLEEYEKRFASNLTEEYAEDLERLEADELIELENNNLKLTRKGFLFSNEVFEVFV
jgi:oxygen-independent coproporphyrinogen-3 oxidase